MRADPWDTGHTTPLADLRATAERMRRECGYNPPAGPVVHYASPAVFAFMVARGWIREDGTFTPAGREDLGDAVSVVVNAET